MRIPPGTCIAFLLAFAAGCDDTNPSTSGGDGGVDGSLDGSTDGGNEDDAGPELEACHPDHPPFEPDSYDSDAYSNEEITATACFERGCLCDGESAPSLVFIENLLTCRPVAGGFYWGLGSATLIVRGRSDGDCVFEVFSEIEGGALRHECRVPLPVEAWEGLSTSGEENILEGIEEHCEELENCCVQLGCPGNECGPDGVPCWELSGGATECDP